MKICKNCVYSGRGGFSVNFEDLFCYHPEFLEGPDIVNGRVWTNTSCRLARSGTSPCGPDGNLYEPTFFAKILHKYVKEM